MPRFTTAFDSIFHVRDNNHPSDFHMTVDIKPLEEVKKEIILEIGNALKDLIVALKPEEAKKRTEQAYKSIGITQRREYDKVLRKWQTIFDVNPVEELNGFYTKFSTNPVEWSYDFRHQGAIPSTDDSENLATPVKEQGPGMWLSSIYGGPALRFEMLDVFRRLNSNLEDYDVGLPEHVKEGMRGALKEASEQLQGLNAAGASQIPATDEKQARLKQFEDMFKIAYRWEHTLTRE
jgi:hypothetical protein